MSANLVSEKHINALVRAAFKVKLTLDGENLNWLNADKLGQILLDENYKSVNYRYEEKRESYDFEYDRKTYDMSLVQFLKLIHSYKYNSSEHPEFKSSKAFGYISRIERGLIEQLDGYDDAEWTI